MVDYAEAIKRPFSDLGKLTIGIILSIIPIVNLLTSGYLLKIASTAMKGRMELPEWKDFGSLFINGILAAIVGIVYMIPVLIVLGILVFLGFMTVPAVEGLAVLSLPAAILGAIMGLGVYLFALLVVAIIFALVSTAAVLRFADTEKFGEAFNFGEVTRTAFRGSFILNWIIVIVIGSIISAILSLIPVIGAMIGIFIVGVFMYTVLGEVYAE